ncbi:patatin-like phospholipase family protein [Castellaniella sp. S9]|uniref:patatin-like phospholipase family protein n=1 Tax=Castellaniella sp. S9 TaxID=2993652 RepID=UPI0022B2E6BC|nr:patatin-like phospholipase family protein [Castellaniella sp. S9]
MPTSHAAPERPAIGLVLTGGGARAAYQAGVLSGVMDILDPERRPGFRNPFPIISGTSAGAINATALACRAHQPHRAIDRLGALWSGLRSEDVYYADAPRLLRTGLQWLGMLGLGWIAPSLNVYAPHSLLDNSPLADLLARTMNFERLRINLARGHLSAVAVTATAYTTGEHLTFYQAHERIKPWTRSLRRAVACPVGVDHLLASSAIPFVFPARAILVGDATLWCGDGSMRQLAPMSSAIHLGAERIFVVGTNYRDETHPGARELNPSYPNLAQVAGHTLSNIFLDSVSMDMERVERINELLARCPPNGLKSESLRPIRSLMIAPSQSLDDLAMAHLQELPRAARTLFRVLGVSPRQARAGSGALVSYLLFEAGYTQDLIALGRADSMSRAGEVEAFFKEWSE